MPVDIHEVA